MKKEYWKFWFIGWSINGKIKMSGNGYLQCPHDDTHKAIELAEKTIKEDFAIAQIELGFPKVQKLKHKPKYF